MSQILVALLAFFAGFLAIFAANMVIVDLQRQERKRMRKRLEEEFRLSQRERAREAVSIRDVSHLAEGFDDDFEDLGRYERFKLWVEQSGVRTTAARLLVVMVMVGFVMGAAAFFFLGNVVVTALTVAIGEGLPLLHVALKRHSRFERMRTQLPDAFDLMARMLRAGQTMSQALQSVADEFQGPIAVEFGYCYEQQNLGLSPEAAYRDLARRTGLLEIKIFVLAVMVQRQTGGNLAQLLEKLANVVRDRFRIRGLIKTLTAEGRLQAIILLALPPAMLVIMLFINYRYTIVLFEYPTILIGLFISMVLGAIWIRRIVSFDF